VFPAPSGRISLAHSQRMVNGRLPNVDRWKFVKKLRLIRIEYRQKVSGAKNQRFNTYC
jgi:hypothetical protein